MTDETTVGAVVATALEGYAALQSLGEEIEDEWTYVTDLAAAWKARLEAVATARGAEPAPAGVEAAVDALVVQAGLVADPHRAIDWLSTFPQVVLVALGETL